MTSRPIIAVDGPAGAGKGTICRAIAHRFGLAYLDTGSLYRAVGLYALESGEENGDALAAWASGMPFSFRGDEQGQFTAWLGEQEVTLLLRKEKTGDAASKVSAIPAVRQALLNFQRHYAAPAAAILDGRDVGTVVWPEAPLKIFVTANLDERAKRRALELQDRGEVANFQEIRQRMAERDQRDQERALSPLRPAEDARMLDTTCLTPDQCTDLVSQWVHAVFPNLGAARS
ncbi:MAG: (d)CMP kinase [Magnetococcales bacterium]|nr:(d)CMP kinase [Magnetococcales bacterium]